MSRSVISQELPDGLGDDFVVATPFPDYLAGRIFLEDFRFVSDVPLNGSLRFDLRARGQRWLALTPAESVVKLEGLLPLSVLATDDFELLITFEPAESDDFTTSRCARGGELCRTE